MGCDCGVKCAKALLMMFNVIFFIIGVVLFAIGIWVRVDNSIWDYVEFIDYNNDDEYLQYGAYFIIAIGAFIFLTSIIGFCGALKESRCALTLYMFIIFIAIAAEIAAAALFIIYRDEIEDEAEERLNNAFDDQIEDPKSGFTISFFKFQEEFECCGINGVTQYTERNASIPGTGHLRDCYASTGENIPCSCCAGGNNGTDGDGCTLYTADCWNEVKDFVEENSILGIGLVIGFGCVQILGFIFALCVCMNAGSSGKYE